MDATEDLSARILLRQILNTEPPRTPITRSVSSRRSGSTATRRSSRLSQDAAAKTPQAILRRSLKHKLTESITRKSLPARRRPAAVLPRKDQISSSMLFDDGETPRHILRNILRTEPVKTPVVHDQGPSEEQEPPSATSSTTRTSPSIELSNLDLPDVTVGNVMSTAKGLSRKRPRRSLNVTAFEKRLRGADDDGGRSEDSLDEQLSLSSASSASLSLKTPFVDVQTEKKGLQRKIAHRRKISVEEFSAAVNNWQMGGGPSLVSAERGLSETTFSESFTLNLSKVSEPDITTDIVNCSTALYPQPDATTSNFSIVATRDEPTVTAYRLQTDFEQDGVMETEQRNLDDNAMEDFCQGDKEVTPEVQNVRRTSRSLGAVDKAQEEEMAHGEPETCFESEDGKGVADSQTDATEPDEEEDTAGSQPEEDVDTGSKSDEEKVVEDLKSEKEMETDEGAAHSESQEDARTESETEEDKDLPQSQTEDEPEHQDDVQIESRVDENLSESVKEEEEEEEEGESEQQTDSLLQHPLETGNLILQLEGEEDENESQNEDEEQREPAVEHISRRSRHSQGALVPVTEAGEDAVDTKAAGVSKAHRTFDLLSDLDVEEPQISSASPEYPGQADSSNQGPTDPSCADNEPNADKENSIHTEEAGEHLSGVSPEEAAPDGGDEQEEWEEEEEEEEEEEDDDLPFKTPPFVRVKRNFFYCDASVSTDVLKNVQPSVSNASEAAPAAKPAQAKPRKKPAKKKPAKKKPTLPKSYLMSVFRHFAKTKVSAEVYPVLDQAMDSFFDRLTADLETYAAHAKRKTIEVEDAVLLLKRQGYVNDKMTVEVLIEKFLRLEQRKLLIPIATSGNVVIPKKR